MVDKLTGIHAMVVIRGRGVGTGVLRFYASRMKMQMLRICAAQQHEDSGNGRLRFVMWGDFMQ